VLVLAVACAVLAQLGVQSLWSSGAWTRVPLRYWTSNSRDSYSFVTWNTLALKRIPPKVPTVALVGGSGARECIWSGEDLAADVRRNGGPRVSARNLSSPKQSWGGSLAVIENLPRGSTVLLGVNLSRFYATAEDNLVQVTGRPLPLKSAALREFAVTRYGAYRYQPTILPGIFRALATRASRLDKSLLGRGGLVITYNPHPMDGRPVTTDAQLARLSEWVNGGSPRRALEKNMAATADLLDETLRVAQQRGLRVVFLELPHNPALSGPGFRERQASYQSAIRGVAARHGVDYLDFSDDLALTKADFIDFSHLRPSGRTKWQARLARELVRLYDRSVAAAAGLSHAPLSPTVQPQGGQPL
jgi:hypothetical protein